MITKLQIQNFKRDGFVILPAFFNLVDDILPIHRGIYEIIGLVIKQSRLAITQLPFSSENFDSGYQEIIKQDRKLGGVIYDAVKQIPSFVRLCSDAKLENLFVELRPQSLPGIAAGGYGIRINNPNESKYRAEWHQEYPAQLRSQDGLVYWSPLKKVIPELGPVKIAVGSHVEGLLPVTSSDQSQGAYALRLFNEETIVSKYEILEPLTTTGDLIVMDFKTVHSSGFNQAIESLWSMQLRYFNFKDETGMKIHWAGSFASGNDFTKIHPELIVGTKK